MKLIALGDDIFVNPEYVESAKLRIDHLLSECGLLRGSVLVCMKSGERHDMFLYYRKHDPDDAEQYHKNTQEMTKSFEAFVGKLEGD